MYEDKQYTQAELGGNPVGWAHGLLRRTYSRCCVSANARSCFRLSTGGRAFRFGGGGMRLSGVDQGSQGDHDAGIADKRVRAADGDTVTLLPASHANATRRATFSPGCGVGGGRSMALECIDRLNAGNGSTPVKCESSSMLTTLYAGVSSLRTM